MKIFGKKYLEKMFSIKFHFLLSYYFENEPQSL